VQIFLKPTGFPLIFLFTDRLHLRDSQLRKKKSRETDTLHKESIHVFNDIAYLKHFL